MQTETPVSYFYASDRYLFLRIFTLEAYDYIAISILFYFYFNCDHKRNGAIRMI